MKQTVWFSLYKILGKLDFSIVIEKTSMTVGMEKIKEKARWEDFQEAGEASGMTDVFVILAVVMVSQLYTYVKTYQIRPLQQMTQESCYVK